MAQCFVTTYRNHYRWPELQHAASARPPYDTFTGVIPDEDIWIETDTNSAKMYEDEEWEKRLRKCYLKRLITTYQFYYCKDMLAKLFGEPGTSSSENQLLKSAKNLYEPESRPKIAPPLPGSRKVFGYIRPTRNYTPLTTYQFYIGKTGYRILKGDFREASTLQEIPEEIIGGNDAGKKAEKVEPPCDCCCCVQKQERKERRSRSKILVK